MGGAGAKIRRKLQRQQKEEESNGVVVSKGKSTPTPTKKTQTTKFRSDKKNLRPKEQGWGERKDFRKKGSGSSQKKPSKKSKEKAFKKPKHLKRKLETAEDETTKEKLLQEIQLFETKKTKLNTHKPPKKVKDSQGKDENQSPGEEIMNNRAEEEENFPRSNPKPSIENKKVDSESKKKTTNKNREKGEKKQVKEPVVKAENPKKQQNKQEKEEAPTKNNGKASSGDESSSSSSSSDNSDSSDDEDEEQEQPQQTRTRGRGRKGRKSTSQQVEEEEKKDNEDTETKTVETTPQENRYCVGRKPVTDFKIGQTYSGKVVYMKPFGVFLDIGCHSDAFCHISRISDEYVEKPQDIFKEGDTVESIRIVEVDRKNKRLTASLQSEARMADEHASMKARKERKEKSQHAKGRKGSVKNNNSKQWDYGNDDRPKPSTGFQHKIFAGRSEAPAFEEKKAPAKPAPRAYSQSQSLK